MKIKYQQSTIIISQKRNVFSSLFKKENEQNIL